MKTICMRALVTLLLTSSGPLHAVGTFIPATDRIDMIHDNKRGLIYISNHDSILRYQISSNSFLPPYILGGELRGVDISPDGNFLAVADATRSDTSLWVHLVDLHNDNIRQLTTIPILGEGGSFTASFDAEGKLLVSTSFNGSGWTPLRRFDITTGQSQELVNVRQNTMLASSGDRSRIGYAEASISSGYFGYYQTSSDMFHTHPTGTNSFNFEISASHDGNQFAVPTYFGTRIYDGNLNALHTLGQYAGPQPIGAAYHPAESLIYLPWATTSQIKVYDTENFTEVDSLDFEDYFSSPGNTAFRQGRTKLSDDGSILMATVTGGVRFHQLYASLSAHDVTTSIPGGVSTSATLDGRIGNGAVLGYEIVQPPIHGSVNLNGNQATYTPDSGFSGTDSFRYRAYYGRANAEANVHIHVGPTNHAPVSIGQTLSSLEDTTLAFNLSAYDEDGDNLSYELVDLPNHGVMTGDGASLAYTPSADFNGTDVFTFKVNDGYLESGISTVVIHITAVNDPPIANNDQTTTTRNIPVTILALANDQDPDGESLSIIGVSTPSNGSALRNGAAIIYTPKKGYVGQDQFNYTIADSHGTTANAVVTVQVKTK